MASLAGVVDTSFLFAALQPGDPRHAETRKLLATRLGVEVAPATLAELEMLVRKRHGLPVARQTIDAFLSRNPHIGVLDADLHPEAMRIWKAHGRLSYTDCHAVAGALLLGNDLLTLDKTQEAAWRAEVKAER